MKNLIFVFIFFGAICSCTSPSQKKAEAEKAKQEKRNDSLHWAKLSKQLTEMSKDTTWDVYEIVQLKDSSYKIRFGQSWPKTNCNGELVVKLIGKRSAWNQIFPGVFQRGEGLSAFMKMGRFQDTISTWVGPWDGTYSQGTRGEAKITKFISRKWEK